MTRIPRWITLSIVSKKKVLICCVVVLMFLSWDWLSRAWSPSNTAQRDDDHLPQSGNINMPNHSPILDPSIKHIPPSVSFLGSLSPRHGSRPSSHESGSPSHGSQHALVPHSYVYPGHIGSDWNGVYKPFYFFLYSAFYDDRKMHTVPLINIYGVVKTKQLKDNKLFCKFTFENGTSDSGRTTATAYTAMSGDFTTNRISVACVMMWCECPKTIPVSVTVLFEQRNVTTVLGSRKIEVLPKVKRKRPLAACVCSVHPPDSKDQTFPHLEPESIVQWMEMQRLLGVDHVTVYVYAVNLAVLRAFTYYVSTGYVTMRSMVPIDADPYKQPRFTSIADCMHRHMNSHQHVLVIDFDEVIVPREADITLVEFIDRHSKPLNPHGVGLHFQFQNVMYFTDGPIQDNAYPEYLSFLRTHYHQEPAPFPGPMKSIQDTSVCHFGSNHKCLLGPGQAVFIPHSIAGSHHYKACEATRSHPWNCSAEMTLLKRDDSMLRYRTRVTEAVGQVLKEL